MLHSTTQIVALEAKAPIARNTIGIHESPKSEIRQKEISRADSWSRHFSVSTLHSFHILYCSTARPGNQACSGPFALVPGSLAFACFRPASPARPQRTEAQDPPLRVPLRQFRLALAIGCPGPASGPTAGLSTYSFIPKPFKRWQVVEFWGVTVMMIQSAVGRLDRQFANQIPYRSQGPRRIHY